jgi:predicted small integral membrane protein
VVLRLAKIAAAASIAAFLTLVTFGNITDYDTNFAFVEHVMAMDTIFPTSTIAYRAITNPVFHHAAYRSIIGFQAVVSLTCWVGVFRLLRHFQADPAAFNRAKNIVTAGLVLAFLLYQFGFVTIGGEWFGMWMSQQWNGVPSAFRFLITIIAVLIFVSLPDAELAPKPHTRGQRP